VCLASEDVVLGCGCVCVLIVVSVVKRSLRLLLQQLLCSSGSVAYILKCTVGFWWCWCFYSAISCEAFIESIIAATVV